MIKNNFSLLLSRKKEKNFNISYSLIFILLIFDSLLKASKAVTT